MSKNFKKAIEKQAKKAIEIWLQVEHVDKSKMLLDPSPSAINWVKEKDVLAEYEKAKAEHDSEMDSVGKQVAGMNKELLKLEKHETQWKQKLQQLKKIGAIHEGYIGKEKNIVFEYCGKKIIVLPLKEFEDLLKEG